MRNTHFGDSGFGFTGKFKNDLSIDSERKMSRKRGTKKVTNTKEDESSLRESQSGLNNNGNQNLNRSITLH